MSEPSVLCLDGGRSGCRARLDPVGGPVVERHARALPYVHAAGGVTAVCEALEEVIAGLPTARADVVVAGLAGVADGAEHAAALAAALAQYTGAQRVVVTGDLVTSYAGALGVDPGRGLDLPPGVVVAAGTGAVAFALDTNGRAARADGWGYLLGDEGSGYWIGRAGLAAALAHHDGRGGSPVLRRRAETAFGPLERLPDVVYGRGDPVTVIAGFASEVAAAAGDGDDVAADLWQQAGQRLAVAAAAAAGRVLGEQAAAVSWTGGLFAAGDLLLAPFRAALAQRAPQLQAQPPAGNALDGARHLARVERLPPGLGWVWQDPGRD